MLAREPETRMDLLFVSARDRVGRWSGWQFVAAVPAHLSEVGDDDLIEAARDDAADRIDGPHRFAVVAASAPLPPDDLIEKNAEPEEERSDAK